MKRICKKLLIFLFIFTTFIGGAFASSRLPNGDKPNERLMNELRGAVRFLNAYYQTGEETEKQDRASELIRKVLRNEKFHDHAVLAFDDTDKESVESYNKALTTGDPIKISEMKKGIEHNKIIRKQFGL